MQFTETTACGEIITAPKLDKMPNGKMVCDFDLSVSHPNPGGGRAQIYHVSILSTNAATVWSQVRQGDEVTVIGQAAADLYTDAAGTLWPRLKLRCNFIRYSQPVFDRMNA